MEDSEGFVSSREGHTAIGGVEHSQAAWVNDKQLLNQTFKTGIRMWENPAEPDLP